MNGLHWAARYIGRPWNEGKIGPLEYSCWGLVRHVCIFQCEWPMPDVPTDTDENQFASIMEAARSGGWRLIDPAVEGPPREFDIVLMRNRDGRRHCAIMVHNGYKLGALHADGTMTERGPRGSVVFQTLEEATAGGYREHEFWRHEEC